MLLIGVTPALRADEGIRQVQEELRKRNLYFGNIDGESTPELASALKRYQKRKGFEVTGDICADTAASLRVQTAVASTVRNAPEWPDLPLDPEPPAEAPAPSRDISPERLNNFIEAYLHDAESNDIYLQSWFYAFPVQYFQYGPRDQKFVVDDITYYVKAWPERKYMLTGPATLVGRGQEGETLVEFSITYDLRNQKKATSGKAKYFWTVRSEGDDLKITAIREQLLPNK